MSWHVVAASRWQPSWRTAALLFMLCQTRVPQILQHHCLLRLLHRAARNKFAWPRYGTKAYGRRPALLRLLPRIVALPLKAVFQALMIVLMMLFWLPVPNVLLLQVQMMRNSSLFHKLFTKMIRPLSLTPGYCRCRLLSLRCPSAGWHAGGTGQLS